MSVVVEHKACKGCGLIKPGAEFRPRRGASDGLMGKCRVCITTEHKARVKVHAPNCLDCGEKTSSKYCVRCRRCSDKGRIKANHPNFKGGRTVTPRGYVYLSGYPDHPNAKGAGAIAEHTLVMSRMLGRALLPEENVHHKNGDRSDNRPENLELWTRSQPPGGRVEDKVAWAVEIIRTYQPSLLREEAHD